MTQTSQPALDWIVLKIAQRCNLNCTYCYVYNRGDDSWKLRPPIILDEVVNALGRRIAEQCAKYSLERFVIEFHGGEPLLVGKKHMQRLIDALRALCPPSVELRMILQTNGILLDDEWLDLFERNHVSFGISLDGPPELADQHRVFLNGEGSTRRLLENIERLRRSGPRFDQLLGGVLCVVNPAVNGGDLVRWFVNNGFDSFEFLLPDANYANLPPGWDGADFRRFLLEAFDAWYAMGKEAPQIRLFETMLLGFMGVKPQLDALGGDLRKLCVVESDGSIGLSDVMRFCKGEYSIDRLNVFSDPLDARTDAYHVNELQRPCAKCAMCPHLKSCGGGYLPHRYDGKSFANPSIYCEALYALGERMAAAIRSDVPPSLVRTHPLQAAAPAAGAEVSL